MSNPPAVDGTGGRLALDDRVRRLPGGALAGGSPPRLMRLSAAGERALAALERGDPETPATRALARRLLDAGIVHPLPRARREPPDVTVVIPARDRLGPLGRCLRALGGSVPVIVVDDGSSDPGATAALARRWGAGVVRRPAAGGPAAARNAGLAATATDLVAFLDSDCVPPPDWLARLAGHFEDPLVAAVAPRIVPLPAARAGPLARYLAARSPLDMGPAPAGVDPGGRVRYVPSAAMIVRRGALVGGFDEALRYGEDVDLIWRLRDAGWRIRYDPAVVVGHEEPERVPAVLARRFRYGSSTAGLARRHPGRLAPVLLRPEAAPTVAALAVGRPRLAGALCLLGTASLGIRLRRAGVPAELAARWAAETNWQSTLAPARYAATFALPLAFGARRRRLLMLACLPALDEWMRRRPRLDPLRFTALMLADDSAYGAGVLWGALRARSVRTLVPGVARKGTAQRLPR